MSTQAITNYIDDAQRRVAVDTLCYQKKATLSVTTTGSVSLPADVIRIEAIFNGQDQVKHSRPDDVLRFLSAGLDTGTNTVAVIGRTLYLLPTPSETQTLTLIYRARTPQFTPDQALTLTGEFETAVDELVQAMTLLDQGETGVAVAQMASYNAKVGLLRRKAGGKVGSSGRLRRVGQRTRPLL